MRTQAPLNRAGRFIYNSDLLNEELAISRQFTSYCTSALKYYVTNRVSQKRM